MKIKEQTRKLAAGCSKHCFEVVDRTDEVSSKHCFEVVDETDKVSNHIYGKATLTWFEEIFEEYKVQIYLFVFRFTALLHSKSVSSIRVDGLFYTYTWVKNSSVVRI